MDTQSLIGKWGKVGRPPKSAYEGQSDTADAISDTADSTDVEQDISQRFTALEDMARGVIAGCYRAVVVSGNPGIGKTFTLERILGEAAVNKKVRYTSVHGYARATGLYRLLYDHRQEGNVILFDDCDSVFGDETSLNLLKAALDSTKKRQVSWHSEKNFKDDGGENLPKSFDFEGSVIFITNLDFDKAISSRLGPYLEALISRSFYLDLNMRSANQLMTRLTSVVHGSSILKDLGLSEEDGEYLLGYIQKNWRSLREVSLRTVVKLSSILKASVDNKEFERVARATCCK